MSHLLPTKFKFIVKVSLTILYAVLVEGCATLPPFRDDQVPSKRSGGYDPKAENVIPKEYQPIDVDETMDRLEQLKTRWDIEPVPIGLRRQVFFDDAIISRITGDIVRKQARPTKLNDGYPVVQADKSWELWNANYGVGGYVSVWKDETDRFRMWYDSGEFRGGSWHLGYAESIDGLKWHKPSMGMRRNNIVEYPLHGAAVYYDLHDTRPGHRYKMAYHQRGVMPGTMTGVFIHEYGVKFARSKDGIRWHKYTESQNITDCRGDTGNSLFWDNDLQCYRVTTRMEKFPRGVKHFVKRRFNSPISDFMKGQNIARLENKCTPVWEERLDPALGEIYSFYIQKYWDIYVAYVYVLEGSHSKFFVAVSRNGIDWDYQWIESGKEFLRHGPPDSFDSARVTPCSSPWVLVGDQWWIYYAGARGGHVRYLDSLESDGKPYKAIGVAAVRMDGLIYLDSKGLSSLETKSFELSGAYLKVNSNASRGKLWVEVIDEEGKPFPGLSAGDCDVFREDGVNLEVTWRGSGNLAALQGQTVRLRFYFQDRVKLYGFQFSEAVLPEGREEMLRSASMGN